MDYELKLAPQRLTTNPVNGQFMKGHQPHNKGKKWSEYMSKRGIKRASKGWKNLDIYRPTKRPDNCGRCRMPIIAVNDEGKWIWFSHAGDAAKLLGGNDRNIRRCCEYNRQGISDVRKVCNTDHRYRGIRYYYEEDEIWINKIKKQHGTEKTDNCAKTNS